MKLNNHYLIHCQDFHIFTGRLVGIHGPAYEFEQVSKVSDTNNGDVWEKLAAGDKNLRTKATYIHFDVAAYLFPLAMFEWVGDLPFDFMVSEEMKEIAGVKNE